MYRNFETKCGLTYGHCGINRNCQKCLENGQDVRYNIGHDIELVGLRHVRKPENHESANQKYTENKIRKDMVRIFFTWPRFASLYSL